jgi:NOL1/NOP2/sun family putative RNA methylase
MPRFSEEFLLFLEDLLAEEKEAFLSTIGLGSPSFFRINTLRVDDEKALKLLEEEGFKVLPLEGLPHAYWVLEEPFPLGCSFSHYLGNIYLQDPSSMVPPLVLDPKEGELVLDVASAPGSKTTQMASLMGNKGLILANEPSVKRSKSLSYNLMKLGVINTVVTLLDGNRLGRLYFETFDKVLLDPPCSALGTLKTSLEPLKWWKMKRSEKLSHLQWNLLVSAIKALKPGGILVYSTCTIVPLENEALISKAVKEYGLQIEGIKWDAFKVRPGLKEFRTEKFVEGIERTIRIYQHEVPGEGFFIAKLRKTQESKPPKERPQLEPLPLVDRWDSKVKSFLDALVDHFGLPEDLFEGFLFERSKELRLYSLEAKRLSFYKYTHRGLPLARLEGNFPTLTTVGAQFLSKWATQNVIDLKDPKDLLLFLKHKPLPIEPNRKGQQIVLYKGHPVGWGIASGGYLKSRAKARKEVRWPFSMNLSLPQKGQGF